MLNIIPQAINGLVQMSQPLNSAERAYLDWLRRDDEAKQADYKTYRMYFDGQYNVPLTDRQEEYLSQHGVKFRENFLQLPVKTMTQRLNVIGFESPDSALVGDDGVLWQWWQANRMDAVQRSVHRATAVDGDTYVLVEWDEEKKMPVITHERAYDGEVGMKVVYDGSSSRKRAFASKRWRYTDPLTGQTWKRLNIYTDGLIYKFRSTGKGSWVQTTDKSDNNVWPMPWAGRDGRPLGVPGFHNRHDDDGGDWGRSELEDLIPVQQALNKAVIDVLEGGDKTAYQLITLSGGKATGLTVGPRQILSHQDPGSSWGHIPAGDVQKLVDLKNDFVVTLAQISQVPLSYFQVTGQVASAETQKADDTGLVSKVEDAAVAYGNFWEDVMSMCVKLSNAFGGTNYNPDAITTKWASFERVDKQASDRTKAETGKIKAETFTMLLEAGVDRYTAAIEAGYDEDAAQVLATDTGNVTLPQIPEV